MSSRPEGLWLRAGSLVGFLAVWQVAAVVADSSVLPTPVAVSGVLVSLTASGELIWHLGVTLARVSAAFLVAMVAGTAIGIVMGRSRRLDGALDSLLVIGLNIPALVTIILCYVWFGLTEAAAITAVALNR